METLIERTCKDCGKALGPGREDKQYCDDACRTNFNNRKRREAQHDEGANATPAQLSIPEYITRIQDILLKNRELLEDLCDEQNVGHIRMRNLVGRGFNLKFFTSETEPTGNGHIYRFCFEYGYRTDEDGMVIVICRKLEIY